MADLSAPAAAFSFILSIAGTGDIDAQFQEVSGLDSEREVTELMEGGENRFVHRLPGQVKHQNLVLKRGIMHPDSELATWILATLENDLTSPIQPKDLTVSLLNPDQEPVMSWTVTQAWPVKLDVEHFNAAQSQIEIDTIEFAYSGLERQVFKSLATPGAEKP